MSDAFRYEPAEPTDEQRKQARQSEAYKQGDLCLIWANKGDLFNIEVGIYRNQIIQELRALALGSEADEYKSYDGHVAEWLAAMLTEPNAEPNRLTDPVAKIKDEARWVAFEDVCRAANKAGEDLPPSVRKLIGGAWADKHVRGGE